jgi:NUDIX domain
MNSARAANTWKTRRPPGVVVSIASRFRHGSHARPDASGYHRPVAWTDPAAWFEQLPSCYLATGMLFTDPQGHVLLVKTHYRPDWGLPGGVAEDNEPPHLACGREIHE